MMTEEEIIRIILDEAFYIHKTIGPGMLENVYKTCLAYRLRKRGLHVETEKAIPVIFEEVKMECGYRSDLLVQNLVVVETKVVDMIIPKHVSQALTHLRFLHLRHGLVLNFDGPLMRDGIRRVINGFGTA
jgi:GxxExxY protein